jgi:L-alanine-DL-glutamate epimerase-like enolase superfamily enzyme
MKISNIETIPFRIKLRFPYKSAKKGEVIGQQYLETLIIRIHTDNGLVGYGEMPLLPKMFESIEDLANLINKRIKGLVIGEDVFNTIEVINRINKKFKAPDIIIASIDIALHDLLGKHLGIPLYKLLGGKISGKVAKPSSLIPLLPPQEAALVAENYVKNGVTVLKMKAGDDPALDIERVKYIRESVGDKVILNLDVGESWGSAKRALKIIKRLEKYWVDFIEQPVLSHDIDGLKEVTRNTDITIVADESVSQGTILRIVYEKAADMIALKPLSQGIITTKRYAIIAEEGGLECSIGTYVAQTGILDAAGLHLYFSIPNITVSEIGRSLLLLENNPAIGIKIENGVLEVFNEPGLGIKMIAE